MFLVKNYSYSITSNISFFLLFVNMSWFIPLFWLYLGWCLVVKVTGTDRCADIQPTLCCNTFRRGKIVSVCVYVFEITIINIPFTDDFILFATEL